MSTLLSFQPNLVLNSRPNQLNNDKSCKQTKRIVIDLNYSDRLLPLVVADSASSFYGTKINNLNEAQKIQIENK
jgi:hypothetical protein